MISPIRLTICFVFLLLSLGLKAQEDSLYYRLNDVAIEGNKVTHKSIIFRELELKEDSLYQLSEIQVLVDNSIRNLQRTRLFNFVEIEKTIADGEFSLLIKVTERWYIWPLPVFELADPNFNIWWQSRDFNRVNVGLNVDHNNFRGRAEKLSLRFKWGYNKQLGLAYTKPFINREKTLGFSISTRYQQRYEVTFATINNERELFARIGRNIREEVQTKFDLIYRPGNRFSSYLTIWQNNTKVKDSVLVVAPDYFGGLQQLNYMGVGLFFNYDSRDLPSYPLKGFYGAISIARPGIGLKEDYNFDIWSTEFSFNRYIPISDRFYTATRVKGGFMSYNQLPYFFQSGFGINGDVRGYELYFVEAQRYVSWQNHIKYALLKGREFRMPFVKNPSFGRVPYGLFISAHMDLAYSEDDVYKYRNPLDRKLLTGYGIGIDFVTYYDKVLRVEYSLNAFGNSGVYLHFQKAF